MLLFLAFGAFANEPVPATTVPSSWAWTVPAEAAQAVRAVSQRPIGERIAAATLAFRGLPYLNDAAGEGEGQDADPPARYDAFDCVTIIEEALGMVLAGDPVDAPIIRDALRYSGAPSYLTRNHFMESQWIPGAIQAGLLVDITDRVGHARTVRKALLPETWKNWRRRKLFALPDAALPLGEWQLRYLDLAEAVLAAPNIPPGSIVVTLRAVREWSPIVTTHISFVVPGPTEPLMRHATRMGKQNVRDDRLSWYMAHLRDYVNWPALGVTVLYPVEQGPRISALLPRPYPDVPLPDAEGEPPRFEPQPIPPLADDPND
jgi:hypothetical protein